MANYTNLNDLFTDMANAIRTKKNSTATIVADTFPTEIESLKTGFDYENQNVTAILDYAFYGCEDLNNVNCYNLTSVGASAFENCANLKTIILYEGVTDVGENAFKGCDCIINYKGDSIPETWHENWNPDDCLVIFGELVETWDISATEEDDVSAELYSVGVDGKYTLLIHGSGTMKNYDIVNSKYTPWYSYRQNIKSIDIFGNITSIGNYAFYNCTSLTSFTVPDGVISIGDNTFTDCANLLSIDIPSSVISIGNAFMRCTNLASIILPEGITSNLSRTFEECTSLTSIIIPNSVTSIGFKAFYGCSSLTSITIPDSVASIGNHAFWYNTSLTSITYTGTIAQWNAITFGSNWNINTGNYTIHCTDGDIAKDGTTTYHTTT